MMEQAQTLFRNYLSVIQYIRGFFALVLNPLRLGFRVNIVQTTLTQWVTRLVIIYLLCQHFFC